MSERKHKRLIDALIATKINGWSNVTRSGRVSTVNWYKGGEKVSSIRNYSPSSNIEQALEAAERVGEYEIAYFEADGENAAEFEVELYGKQKSSVCAGTLPMAISLAILEAQQISTNNYQSADDLLIKDTVPVDGDTHTHCLRCGRPLRSKESQIRGYGPECARREYEEPSLIRLLQEQHQQANFMDELTQQRELVG